MDPFVANAALVAMVPVAFTAKAWSNAYEDRPFTNANGLTTLVLCLNSATALLLLGTILSDLPQQSISRIAVPSSWLCVCISVLSVVKIHDRRYRSVCISSSLLSI